MKNGRAVAGRKKRTPNAPPAVNEPADAADGTSAEPSRGGSDTGSSYQLRAEESLRKGVRRIARKQLEKAVAGLTGSRKPTPDAVVHRARRRLKRVRALLREIMTDEMAHVGQRRNFIGSTGIHAAHAMVGPMFRGERPARRPTNLQ